MKTDITVRWLAFASLMLSLLSLGLDSDGQSLAAAATIMCACVVLTYSQRKIKEEK